jgi:hypothetical protein
VVQVSGGALARTSSVAPSIKDKSKHFGEKGRHNFPSRAAALLFFFKLLLTVIAQAALARGKPSEIHPSDESPVAAMVAALRILNDDTTDVDLFSETRRRAPCTRTGRLHDRFRSALVDFNRLHHAHLLMIHHVAMDHVDTGIIQKA